MSKRVKVRCKKMHQNEEDAMDCQTKIIELRGETGLNRKEFCEKFGIPYRTVTEWERGTRNAPDYVLRMLEYYIHTEKILAEQE